MTKKLIKILLIEDDPQDADFIKEILPAQSALIKIDWEKELISGLTKVSSKSYDAVLLDLGLPDSQGLDTFNKVHQTAPTVPIIILTGLKDDELAREAVRVGAQDYLNKGEINPKLLYRTIQYSVQRKQAQSENSQKVRLQGALELAGAASHDLSQPLQVIAGFIHLLHSQYSDDNFLSEKLDIMEKQLLKVNTIIYQLQNITNYRTKTYLWDTKILDIEESIKGESIEE